MTRQEIIREELEVKINRFDTFGEEYSYGGFADEILSYLDSQGVVIKVDRELPFYSYRRQDEEYLPRQLGYKDAQQDMLMAGYEAVEPLIKDEDVKE